MCHHSGDEYSFPCGDISQLRYLKHSTPIQVCSEELGGIGGGGDSRHADIHIRFLRFAHHRECGEGTCGFGTWQGGLVPHTLRNASISQCLRSPDSFASAYTEGFEGTRGGE